MHSKTCFILNYAPHYRKPIFEKLSKELDCDIYCGNKIRVDIKKIDFNSIDFSVKELKTVWFLNKLAWMKGQLKLLFNKKYSTYVLTGQPFFLSDTVFIILCLFTQKKVLIWNHGLSGNETGLKKLYYRIFYSMIDGMFVYSNRGKRIVTEQYGLKDENLHVIYNSLDYAHHLQMRTEVIDGEYYQKKNYFKNPSLPILIFIGRLTASKRIDLLIEAIKDLKGKGFYFNLMVIGDGVDKTKSVERSKDISDFTCFLGSSYDELENAKLLANADLCVSPGNAGLNVIHSFSFGTPVCTHDDFAHQGPETEAIEPFKTGILYNLEKNDLASVIQKWFESNLNRDEVRTNCYKKIDGFYNPDFQYKVFENALTTS